MKTHFLSITMLSLCALIMCACDKTPPAIILTGGDMELPLGTTYIEPGVIAEDDADGVIYNVVSTNNIDKTKVGSYTVNYSVKDKAGNTSTKSRKVNYTATLLAGYYNVSTTPNQSSYNTTVAFASSTYNKLIFSKFGVFPFNNDIYLSNMTILIDKNTYSILSENSYIYPYGNKPVVTISPGTIEYTEGTSGQWIITSMTYTQTITYPSAEESTVQTAFFQ